MVSKAKIKKALERDSLTKNQRIYFQISLAVQLVWMCVMGFTMSLLLFSPFGWLWFGSAVCQVLILTNRLTAVSFVRFVVLLTIVNYATMALVIWGLYQFTHN